MTYRDPHTTKATSRPPSRPEQPELRQGPRMTPLGARSGAQSAQRVHGEGHGVVRGGPGGQQRIRVRQRIEDAPSGDGDPRGPLEPRPVGGPFISVGPVTTRVVQSGVAPAAPAMIRSWSRSP